MQGPGRATSASCKWAPLFPGGGHRTAPAQIQSRPSLPPATHTGFRESGLKGLGKMCEFDSRTRGEGALAPRKIGKCDSPGEQWRRKRIARRRRATLPRRPACRRHRPPSIRNSAVVPPICRERPRRLPWPIGAREAARFADEPRAFRLGILALPARRPALVSLSPRPSRSVQSLASAMTISSPDRLARPFFPRK
jgi:hypothetical protein